MNFNKCCLLFCLLFSAKFSMGQQPVVNPADSAYFPIAVWLQNTGNAQRYHDAGINMYIGLYQDLDEKQLNELTEAKMKLICAQGEFGLKNLNNPVIYGWAQDDEPDNAQWNPVSKKYDPCIDPKIIIHKYHEIKSKDPNRPVYLNLGQGVSYINWIGRGECTGNTHLYSADNGYLQGCDIASFDIYPVNSNHKSITGNLWYVPKGIDSLKKWAGKEKPIWTWIEVTKIDSSASAKPNPMEVKSQVWMALIHGTKGFGYFCHSWTPKFDDAALLHDLVMLPAIKAINNQITSLATILNSPDVADFATVKTNNAVPIDIMAKKGGLDNYLFAVAMRHEMTIATFDVASGNRVEVLGENRIIPISKGKFTDHFQPYEVHLYKITTGLK